jgi:hypothetical protein
MNSIVGEAITLAPAPLLVLGWARWLAKRESPHIWRQNLVAVGLGLASISAACLYGVVLYFRAVHIGYWNEYVTAAPWALLAFPISVLAVVAAIVGKGVARILLALAGALLVLIWAAAFVD